MAEERGSLELRLFNVSGRSKYTPFFSVPAGLEGVTGCRGYCQTGALPPSICQTSVLRSIM